MSEKIKGEQLFEDGYCVIPGALGAASLAALSERFNADSLSRAPGDNFGKAGAFIVADYHDPVLIDLFTNPVAMDALAYFGYANPKLHNYYVSAKQPGAEALPWHSDLFYPYDKKEPAELFLIYYLQDTAQENGCLRVVPGSHHWSQYARTVKGHDTGKRPDETDVPIQAGDLFIGDRRILHATHPNQSSDWRTGITIAYAPDFDTLPKQVKKLITQNQCLPPLGWWNGPIAEKLDSRLRPILPVYDDRTALPDSN